MLSMEERKRLASEESSSFVSAHRDHAMLPHRLNSLRCLQCVCAAIDRLRRDVSTVRENDSNPGGMAELVIDGGVAACTYRSP